MYPNFLLLFDHKTLSISPQTCTCHKFATLAFAKFYIQLLADCYFVFPITMLQLYSYVHIESTNLRVDFSAFSPPTFYISHQTGPLTTLVSQLACSEKDFSTSLKKKQKQPKSITTSSLQNSSCLA